RILDQGRASGSCVQTVARRGYRFTAEVRQGEAWPNRRAAAIPASAGGPPPRLSIVVLPIANPSGEPEGPGLARAITDDLTTNLTRISDMFVISRTTALTYKGRPVDVRQVGRELGVHYVLEGSVRRSGSYVRVNMQLIDAETGGHLWAERFETDQRSLGE